MKNVNACLSLCIIAMVLFVQGCSSNIYEEQIPSLIGVKEITVEERHVSEEWGGFQGEGYTIETYKLDSATIKQFTNIKFNTIPEKEEAGWAKHDWSQATFDTSYREVLSVALDYGGSKALESQSAKIMSIINRTGVYHAFYYRPDKINPQSVRLFVIDANSNTMYVIASDV